MENIQDRIDSYFQQLSEFIEKLPISEKGRNYIWFNSFCKFYDMPVFDENGNTTYGIQTEWQLKKFIEQFKKNIEKTRLKAVKSYLNELDSINPNEAISKVSIQMFNLKREKHLSKIGGQEINEWKKWLMDCFSNELEYHQTRLSIEKNKPKQQPQQTTYIWQNQPEKELPELYSLMVNQYKLIASDTTLDQFKAIFTGQAVDTIKPIEWLIQKNLLAYFIEKLYDKKRLSKLINPNIWSIASHCFVDAKHLSQIVDQYYNNKKKLPRNYHIIDELLNSL